MKRRSCFETYKTGCSGTFCIAPPPSILRRSKQNNKYSRQYTDNPISRSGGLSITTDLRGKSQIRLNNKREMSNITWLTTENKCSIPDIRDPMYINTYCSNERPLRYKEISLPRISTERPLTDIKVSSSHSDHPKNSEKMVYYGQTTGPNGWVGSMTNRKRQQKISTDSKYLPFCDISRVPIQDKVRQSADGTVPYHKNDDMVSSRSNRPLRAENGKYRPFSTIVVKIPKVSREGSSSPKLCISVEQYIKYVENKALRVKVQEFQPSPGSITPKRFNTAFSRYHDFDNQAVQFVMNENRPCSHRTLRMSPSSVTDSTSNDEFQRNVSSQCIMCTPNEDF